MATKEIMLVVPVVVWLYDACFVSRGFAEPTRHRSTFYAGLGATYAVIFALVLSTFQDSTREVDPHRFGSYVLSQPCVLVHYLRVAVWPQVLHLYAPGSRFAFDPGYDGWGRPIACALVLAVLGLAGVRALLRLRPSGFLAACLVLPLLPTTLLTTNDVIAERRTYLPLAAGVAGVVAAAGAGVQRLSLGSRRPAFVSAVAVLLLSVVVAGLAVRTRARNEDYRSETALYDPEGLPWILVMLGERLLLQSDLRESQEILEALLALETAPHEDPRHDVALRPRALNALGAAHALTGRLASAERDFALALDAAPAFARARNNLGVVRFLRGHRTAARQDFVRASFEGPALGVTHYHAGLAALLDGDRARGFRHFTRMRELGWVPPADMFRLRTDLATRREKTRFVVIAHPTWMLAEHELLLSLDS